MKRVLKPAVFVLCLVPLAILAWRWAHNDLGFNRIETVARYTGDWTLRFLLISLTITPLRRLPRLNGLIKYRRMLGLFAFFYGCLHFAHYVAIDKLWEWAEIKGDFLRRRFYIAGLISLTLMVPLAATSFNAAIRALGGKRWQWLHRLVYISAIAGVVHFYWQGKAALLDPVIYMAILAILLLYRLTHAFLKARSAKHAPARPQRNPAY